MQQLLREQLQKDPAVLGLSKLQQLDPQQLLLSENLFQHQAMYLWLNEKLTGLQVGSPCLTSRVKYSLTVEYMLLQYTTESVFLPSVIQ